VAVAGPRRFLARDQVELREVAEQAGQAVDEGDVDMGAAPRYLAAPERRGDADRREQRTGEVAHRGPEL